MVRSMPAISRHGWVFGIVGRKASPTAAWRAGPLQHRLTVGVWSRNGPPRAARAFAQAAPVLGALEAAVMDRVWADAPVDVKTVHRAIGASRGITLNTVQSTM